MMYGDSELPKGMTYANYARHFNGVQQRPESCLTVPRACAEGFLTLNEVMSAFPCERTSQQPAPAEPTEAMSR